MFGINTYLISDLVNIILDYLYAPDIKSLNEEYHRKYKYDGHYTLVINYNWYINYKNNTRTDGYKIDKHYYERFNLPNNYWYTSGLSSLEGYK